MCCFMRPLSKRFGQQKQARALECGDLSPLSARAREAGGTPAPALLSSFSSVAKRGGAAVGFDSAGVPAGAMEYKVKFEVFEGPLDLLLYLIKKEEVDIYEVNLTKLATEFIEYIDVMRMLDLEIAGEFLVMASTLMYIKSRELLPVDQQVTAEG